MDPKTFLDNEGNEYDFVQNIAMPGHYTGIVIKLKPQEPQRWRAKNMSQYFYVDNDGLVEKTPEAYVDEDNRRHKLGNYFRTREQAEASAEALKAFFTYIHDADNRHNNRTDFNHLATKAAFAVQEDN